MENKWQNILSKRELETINRLRNGGSLHLNLLATEAIRKMTNLLDKIEEIEQSSCILCGGLGHSNNGNLCPLCHPEDESRLMEQLKGYG